MTDVLHAFAQSLRDEIEARYPHHDLSVHKDPDLGDAAAGWMVEGEQFSNRADRYNWYNISITSWAVIYHDSCTKRVQENIRFSYEDPALMDGLMAEIARSVQLWE